MIAVAPQDERNFDNAFKTVLRSVRINDLIEGQSRPVVSGFAGQRTI